MERLRSILGSSGKDSGPMEMEDVRSKSINMRERAISAAGAAFISAVIVNPLIVEPPKMDQG
jgi:hypothetical protein